MKWASLLAAALLLLSRPAKAQDPTKRPAAGPASPSTVGIPIRIRLEREGLATLVVEDAAGNRVRNLIAEARLPAGESTIAWDGYDDGVRDEGGDLVRRRVAPGTYRLRGLAHDGLSLRYEFTVDNPGRPPWQTRDGSGAWLADHSPPADLLRVPGGVPTPNDRGRATFLACSTSAEAGDEFAWLDADGRRLCGTNDGFWGGTHLARDEGADPARDHVAYVFENGQRDADNFDIEVRGFRATDGRLESVLKYPRPRELRTFKGNEAYGSDGLAVRDGRLVLAVTMLDRLVFADARARRVVGEATLPGPRSPAFDREGRLCVLTAGKVRRFRVAPDSARLDEGEDVVSEGLEDPRRLRIDGRGNLYVSDWGKSHQVKVFDSQGRHVRTFGEPGGPQLGLYDERRMAHPCGADVDAEGRLWVAEGDAPRRVSVWAPDGSFLRALYGPMKYGGGGTIDPRDRTRFYYDDGGIGIEFALDWEKGTSRVRSVYWRRDMTRGAEAIPDNAPERSFYAGGFQYLVNCYNGTLRFNQDRCTAIWRMDPEGVARPVAMLANAADLTHGVWGWPMRHKDAIVRLWDGRRPETVMFTWSDDDGDGVAQPGEIRWVAEDHGSSRGHEIGGVGFEALVHPDLSVTTAYGTRLGPPSIDARGVPHYDLEARTKVGQPEALRSPLIAGDRVILHEDADGSWLGSDLGGARRWRYPATPEEQVGGPGAMTAPTRLLGPPVAPIEGQAGPLVAINGEMGAIFLLTMDGLFVQTLGGDARILPPISERDPRRGWSIAGVTFQQEHFHPTISQAGDGTVYLTVGFQQGTIARLDGLSSIRRLDLGTVAVREGDVAGLPATSTLPARKQGRPSGDVAIRASGPGVDGDLSDWPDDTRWMRVDERAEAAAAVAGGRLYLAFRTDDPALLDNSGRDPRYLFKTGGAIDVMLGTNGDAPRDRREPVAGDLRLLLTRVDGKPTAIVYRPIAPGAAESSAATYESPIGKVRLADVRALDDTKLSQAGGNYEASVPLDALGLRPGPGVEILADVGVLRGREGRTMRRAYWSNLDTLIVSDLPSEARLAPGKWGLWRFR